MEGIVTHGINIASEVEVLQPPDVCTVPQHRCGCGCRPWLLGFGTEQQPRPPRTSTWGWPDGSHPRPWCLCWPLAPKANQKQRTGRGWWHASLCFIVGQSEATATATAAPPPSASAHQQTPNVQLPQPLTRSQGPGLTLGTEPHQAEGLFMQVQGWRQSSSMGLLSS